MATILVFFCLLENEPLLQCSRENILLNFEFKNKATSANLQVNRRILKWWPFWNKVYYTLFTPCDHAKITAKFTRAGPWYIP